MVYQGTNPENENISLSLPSPPACLIFPLRCSSSYRPHPTPAPRSTTTPCLLVVLSPTALLLSPLSPHCPLSLLPSPVAPSVSACHCLVSRATRPPLLSSSSLLPFPPLGDTCLAVRQEAPEVLVWSQGQGAVKGTDLQVVQEKFKRVILFLNGELLVTF